MQRLLYLAITDKSLCGPARFMERSVVEGEGTAHTGVSMVLPTYNERENVRGLVGALQDLERVMEVIVVDDDSPDGTAAVVRGLAEDDPGVKLIVRTEESGLPSAIRDGIEVASGDRVGWMDCDGSHPPAVVPRLIDALDDGADVAVGSRFVPGGGMEHGPVRRAMSREVCGFAGLVLGRGVRDYTSGFVVADADVVEAVGWGPDHLYGEYCIEFLYRAQQDHVVEEVPYVSGERSAGDSKTTASVPRLARLGLRYHAFILRLGLERLVT